MTTVAELQSTLKLLSDPVRLRLLGLLALEELAVHELVSITGLAQSRVSNHLALLRRSGLVLDRREGSWSFHRLAVPSATGPLTPELFDAVLKPYFDSEAARADVLALETVREKRREQSRSAHDALAERWREVGEDFAVGSLRREALSALVPRDLVIADLGCGAGFLTEFLAGHGARVIAVDHSTNMLDHARDFGGGATVEFRVGEMEQLPLADGEVDAAFANLVWHHLADMDRAAVEVARIVRPGGTVVITDLATHEEDWMRQSMGDLRLGLRPDAVAAALARAGFVELRSDAVHDRYRVTRPNGAEVELPMFMVSGRRVPRRLEPAAHARGRW